jgi:hypothetical protein
MLFRQTRCDIAPVVGNGTEYGAAHVGGHGNKRKGRID